MNSGVHSNLPECSRSSTPEILLECRLECNSEICRSSDYQCDFSPLAQHSVITTQRVVVSSSGSDGIKAGGGPASTVVRKTVTLTAAGPNPTAAGKEGVYLVTLPQGHIRQGQNNIVVMNRPAQAAEQHTTHSVSFSQSFFRFDFL